MRRYTILSLVSLVFADLVIDSLPEDEIKQLNNSTDESKVNEKNEKSSQKIQKSKKKSTKKKSNEDEKMKTNEAKKRKSNENEKKIVAKKDDNIEEMIPSHGDPDNIAIGKPFQIIQPTLNHESLRVNSLNLARLSVITHPISIVSVVGPYHSGKSFLLNSLLGDMNAFSIGPKTSPETMGIWLCRTALKSPIDGSEIWLMDSEGFFGPGISEDYDARIFSIAAILGSHLVYNTIKVIDQQSVNLLEMLGRRAQLFKTRSGQVVTNTNTVNAVTSSSTVKSSNTVTSSSSSKNRKNVITPDFLMQMNFPSLTWIVEDFTQESGDKSDDLLAWLKSYLSQDVSKTLTKRTDVIGGNGGNIVVDGGNIVGESTTIINQKPGQSPKDGTITTTTKTFSSTSSREASSEGSSSSEGHFLSRLFKDISVKTLFLPAVKKQQLRDLSKMKYEELTEEFRIELEEDVKPHIFDKVKSKSFSKEQQFMTGIELQKAIHFIVNALQTGVFPELPSLWASWTSQVAEHSLYDSERWFRTMILGGFDGGFDEFEEEETDHQQDDSHKDDTTTISSGENSSGNNNGKAVMVSKKTTIVVNQFPTRLKSGEKILTIHQLNEKISIARLRCLRFYLELLRDFDVSPAVGELKKKMKEITKEAVVQYQSKIQRYFHFVVEDTKEKFSNWLAKVTLPIQPEEFARISNQEIMGQIHSLTTLWQHFGALPGVSEIITSMKQGMHNDGLMAASGLVGSSSVNATLTNVLDSCSEPTLHAIPWEEQKTPMSHLSTDLNSLAMARGGENDRLISSIFQSAVTATVTMAESELSSNENKLYGVASLQSLKTQILERALDVFQNQMKSEAWLPLHALFKSHRALINEEVERRLSKFESRNYEKLTSHFREAFENVIGHYRSRKSSTNLPLPQDEETLASLHGQIAADAQEMLLRTAEGPSNTVTTSTPATTSSSTSGKKEDKSSTTTVPNNHSTSILSSASLSDTQQYADASAKLGRTMSLEWSRLQQKNIDLWKIHADEVTQCAYEKNNIANSECSIVCPHNLLPPLHRSVANRHLLECFKLKENSGGVGPGGATIGKMGLGMQQKIFESWYQKELHFEATQARNNCFIIVSCIVCMSMFMMYLNWQRKQIWVPMGKQNNINNNPNNPNFNNHNQGNNPNMQQNPNVQQGGMSNMSNHANNMGGNNMNQQQQIGNNQMGHNMNTPQNRMAGNSIGSSFSSMQTSSSGGASSGLFSNNNNLNHNATNNSSGLFSNNNATNSGGMYGGLHQRNVKTDGNNTLQNNSRPGSFGIWRN